MNPVLNLASSGRYSIASNAPVVYSNLAPYHGQMLEDAAAAAPDAAAAAPAAAPPAGPPAIPVVAVADNYAQAPYFCFLTASLF